MVFVYVNGVTYNTDTIRRIIKPNNRNSQYTLLYAGRDRVVMPYNDFEVFVQGLRGKGLITPADKDALMDVPEESEDGDDENNDDDYY